MTKMIKNGQVIYEAPYSQIELEEIVNKVRIEERYVANKIMGDLGIPAQNRPKDYRDAGEIVLGMILAPPKKEEPDPGSG